MQTEIYVVDIASQHSAYLVSKTRPFRINEILVIEDLNLNNPRCEVVETTTTNKNYNIINNDVKILETSVIKNLELLGIDLQSDTIYIANVQFLNELPYPVKIGSKARLLNSKELEETYIYSDVVKSLKLGVFNSTVEVFDKLNDKYKDLFMMHTKNGITSQNQVPFLFPYRKLDEYPHIQVTGGSGSGKSYFLRALSEEIMLQRIPTLCLDPHSEFDFSTTMDGLPSHMRKEFKDRYVILQAGKDVNIDFREISSAELVQLLSANYMNFSEHMQDAIYSTHERGMTLESYIRKLEKITIALTMSFKELEDEQHKDLADLQKKYSFMKVSTIEGLIRRMNGLLHQQLFGTQGIKVINENLLKGKFVVVQGKIKYLRMFSGYLLNNLYKKRRDYRDKISQEPFPGFFVLFDEAHNFAPNNSDDVIPSKYIIREIAQEGRKYGIFLIPATQRPSLLDSTTQAQINTKIIFRTTRDSDIEIMRKETDLSKEDIKRLPFLQPGNCFISSAIIGRTIFSQVRSSYTKSPHSENSFDETFKMIQGESDSLLKEIKHYFPISELDLLKIVHNLNVSTEKEYTTHSLKNELEHLVQNGKLTKDENFITGTTYFLTKL